MKHIKEILSLVLTACMLCAMLPAVTPSAKAATTVLQTGADLRAAVAAAGSGDVIDLNGQTFIINDDTNDSSPWAITTSVTLQNGTIVVSPGGIILGADVTFSGIQLDFPNTVRNVIAANGHTLTLINTTRATTSTGTNSAQQVHLVCGGMLSANGMVGSTQVPASGAHGRIIIEGSNVDLGNIYAGHLSTNGTTLTASTIPATITINAVNSSIGMSHTGLWNPQQQRSDANPSVTVTGGIYASGAVETPTPGLTLDPDYTQLPPVPIEVLAGAPAMNAKVTVNLSSAAAAYVNGQTSTSASHSEVVFNGADTLTSGVTLKNVGTLTVSAGKFAPSASSDLQSTNVAVSGTARLGLTNLAGTYAMINGLSGSGSGTIVLSRQQQLFIQGNVSGSTKISVGGDSYDDDISSTEPVDQFTYVNATLGSADGAFSLWPYASNPGITLEHNGSGLWTAKHPAATALSFADSAAYDIPASTAGTPIANVDVSATVGGGTPPYTYSAQGLPTGITIDSGTGVISGTPTAAANASTATITVTDSASPTPAAASITIAVGEISAAKVPTGVTVSASPSGSVAVPEKGSTATVRLTATAQYSDTSTADVTGQTTWTLVGSYSGVSIAGNVVTITPEASAGSISFQGNWGAEQGANTVTLTKNKAGIVSALGAISGPDSITASAAGSATGAYSITAEDAYGATVSPGVTWSVSGPSGVSIDAGSGLLTVSAGSAAGTATITATSGNLQKTKTVFITRADARPAAIAISRVPNGDVAVPTAGIGAAAATRTSFSAAVYDQYGAPVASPAVTWSCSSAAGVSIDAATGVLTVDNTAQTGTATVTADCAGVRQTMDVSIIREASAATYIQILKDGAAVTSDILSIPATGSGTAAYTAAVYDQYGVQMSGSAVTWSVTGGALPSGVAQAGGTVTLSAGADGGSFTLAAESGGKTASVAVTVSSRTAVSLSLTPSAATLAGGGTVTLTVGGIPAGGVASVSCADASVAVTGSGAVWTAVLPDATKTYTFTANFTGDAVNAPARASCTVSVTKSGTAPTTPTTPTTPPTTPTTPPTPAVPTTPSSGGGGSLESAPAVRPGAGSGDPSGGTGGTQPSPVPGAPSFTDVPAGSRFAEAVAFMEENGLMNGISEGVFGGNELTTRAMVWTILGRGAGQELVGPGVFERAADWAKARGVSDGSAPNGLISRQQFAVMLWRLAGSPTSGYSLGSFTDSDQIADYALIAVRWAAERGILQGNAGQLNPAGNATRYHIAAMYMRFVRIMGL